VLLMRPTEMKAIGSEDVEAFLTTIALVALLLLGVLF